MKIEKCMSEKRFSVYLLFCSHSVAGSISASEHILRFHFTNLSIKFDIYA